MSASGELLCTQDELNAMCRTGGQLLDDALAGGDRAAIAETLDQVLSARGGFAAVYVGWMSAMLSWLFERKGSDALTAALDPEGWVTVANRIEISLEQSIEAKSVFLEPAVARDELLGLYDAGDLDTLRARWAQIEASTLKLHTYRRDWVTSVLSGIYRDHGVDGLNDSLLYAGNQPWWQAGMIEEEKVTDPVARVRQWAFMLSVGVFSEISLTEEPDAFVIHHRVCGSCGRQELDGRYEEPWNFLRVIENVPGLNFSDPNFTVYRAHIPVIHYVVATETVGHPWPVIDCSGVPGKCWFRIYKDPADTPEEYFTRAGLTKA